MKNLKYFFSLIIVSKNQKEANTCLLSLQKLATPYRFEVILSTGNNPGYQRNMAAQKAQGNILVFLDNDSVVSPKLLDQYAYVFDHYARVDCVGGPSCLLAASNQFEKSIDLVFTSDFGLGPVKSRYFPFGNIRPANEKDLILCNMAVKKSVFLEVGGFNTVLHPNEENLFLNILAEKHTIYYNPLAIVYRHHRANLWQFAVQMLRYGSGRIKHYRLRPEFFNFIFMIPLAFFLYCTCLLLASCLGHFSLHASLPLFLYMAFTLAATVFGIFSTKNVKLIFSGPALFFLCHYFYGLGEIWEILTLRSLAHQEYQCTLYQNYDFHNSQDQVDDYQVV